MQLPAMHRGARNAGADSLAVKTSAKELTNNPTPDNCCIAPSTTAESNPNKTSAALARVAVLSLAGSEP